MTNIEQKVFATQKHMDSYQRTQTAERPSSPLTKQMPAQPSAADETIQTMLKTLKKQQDQIASFMKNTQSDLKAMQGQLLEPQAKKPEVDVKAMLREMNDEQEKEEREITQKLSKLDQKLKKIPSKYDKPAEPKVPKTYKQLGDRPPSRQDMSPHVAEPEVAAYKSAALKLPSELGPVDKKMLKAERLSAIWLTVARLAHQQDYQSAYETCLAQLDDVYLLRLVMMTGPVVSRGLSDTIGKQVLHRMNRITRSGMLYKMQVDWLEDSLKQDLFCQLTPDEKNQQMDALYQMASADGDLVKPQLKKHADAVYQKLRDQAAFNFY